MTTGMQPVHVQTRFKELHLNIFDFLSAPFLLFEYGQDPVIHGQSAYHRFLGVETVGSITSFAIECQISIVKKIVEKL